MNCREVTEILDDRNLDGLGAEQRRQAEAHVAACADCARVWNLQASLAALPDIAVPANFAARCRARVAAGSGPAVSRRAARRFVLPGALAAFAAAAAVLAILLWPTPESHDRTLQVVQPEVAAPVVGPVSLEPATGLVPAVAIAAEPETRFTVRVVPYRAPTEEELAASGEPEALRSLFLPAIRAHTADPVRMSALQSLHTALVAELAGVPGLVLVASDPVEVPASSKHYRLTVAPVFPAGADGRVLPFDNRWVAVGLNVEQMPAGGTTFSRRPVPISSGIDLQANCPGAVPTADAPCRDVRGVAAELVRALRRDVFPPDSAVTRPLQAKFKDTSLDVAERFKALTELFQLKLKTGDTSLRDPDLVRAAIELAAGTTPAQRARLWRMLRGVGNADLIEPMINSLLQDPDDVRLAAIDTLAADFSANPRVRAALEAASLGDSRPLVRAVAERGLSGEAQWQDYVAASLKDPNLPAAQRVEALVYYLYPPGPDASSSPTHPEYSAIMQQMLDDDAIRALAAALPATGQQQGWFGGALGNFVDNFGARYAKHPAVTEMLLNYLQHDPAPRMRRSAVSVLSRTHANDPRVREALQKAMNSDPDSTVRDAIRQGMTPLF